jgi:urocanate hydratase
MRNKNKMVVGSQARILYADAEGRSKIAEAFNNAVANRHNWASSFR